jgi:hypothetical protein
LSCWSSNAISFIHFCLSLDELHAWIPESG